MPCNEGPRDSTGQKFPRRIPKDASSVNLAEIWKQGYNIKDSKLKE